MSSAAAGGATGTTAGGVVAGDIVFRVTGEEGGAEAVGGDRESQPPDETTAPMIASVAKPTEARSLFGLADTPMADLNELKSGDPDWILLPNNHPMFSP